MVCQFALFVLQCISGTNAQFLERIQFHADISGKLLLTILERLDFSLDRIRHLLIEFCHLAVYMSLKVNQVHLERPQFQSLISV